MVGGLKGGPVRCRAFLSLVAPMCNLFLYSNFNIGATCLFGRAGGRRLVLSHVTFFSCEKRVSQCAVVSPRGLFLPVPVRLLSRAVTLI